MNIVVQKYGGTSVGSIEKLSLWLEELLTKRKKEMKWLL